MKCTQPDRYHDTDNWQWKPFNSQLSIGDLLTFITQRYSVTPIYLDGDLEDTIWANLDDEIDNSVAIIDLFSIDQKNKQIAQKFDTYRAGVMMPLCRTLKQELVEIATEFKSEFRVLKAKSMNSIPCDCYYSDIASVENFNKLLSYLFRTKFPIISQSVTNSAFRTMKMNIQ